MFEPHQLLLFVSVNCLDERRSRAIGGSGDLAGQRRSFERGSAIGERTDDQHSLSRLHVQRNLYGELGICLQLPGEIHQAILHGAGSTSLLHERDVLMTISSITTST